MSYVPADSRDSFIKNCLMISHPDQSGYMFVEEDGRYYARLQDMVIMPLEKYEAMLAEIENNKIVRWFGK